MAEVSIIVCRCLMKPYSVQDGSIQEYENNFSLLSPLICEAIAVKEDRRSRRTVPQSSSGSAGASSSGNNGAAADTAMDVGDAGASAEGTAADGSAAHPAVSSTAPSSHHLV
jgi:hypothetical protein